MSQAASVEGPPSDRDERMTLEIFADRVVLGKRHCESHPPQYWSTRHHFSGSEATRKEWLGSPPGFRKRVDLGGALDPALSIHTHFDGGVSRNWNGGHGENVIEDVYFRVESALTADDVRAFARIGAYNLLHVGVVWDHYYFGDAVADALLDTGLSGVWPQRFRMNRGPECHGSTRSGKHAQNFR